MADRKLIGTIEVVQGPRRGDVSLLIDGEEFPWYIGEDITTTVSPSGFPSIIITLPADALTIRHSITPAPNN